jgi:flagellar P-ring protein precursor FlgI
MQMKKNGLKMLLCIMCAVFLPSLAQAEKIRDLANIEGVRDNQLLGYGLVVGLDGTGDQTQQAPFTGQSLINMLGQLGVSIPPGTNMQLRNVAAVMITANLPPFSRIGQRLDINVSSVGNAKSLRGGTLLMSPLKGSDGNVYAVAQGNVIVGGIGAQAGGSSVAINQQSGGRIDQGAIIEREVKSLLVDGSGTIDLQLKEASFTTVQRTVDAINYTYGKKIARAVDSRVIELQVPGDSDSLVHFIGEIENLSILPAESKPKVVINARTGSVVLSGNIVLRQAAVAHGNITVTIDTEFMTSQPNLLAKGETVTVPKSKVKIEQAPGTLNLVQGANLTDVVGALNDLGATPDELMSILQALKAAGALRAEIEII